MIEEEHTPADPQGKIDPRFMKINRYLCQHYNEAVTLRQLADIFEINPVYLSNMYSKHFSIPPIKHLQQIKMRKAQELLGTTDLCIKDISHHLGYISPSQFSGLFKRYFGCTPVQYRRKVT